MELNKQDAAHSQRKIVMKQTQGCPDVRFSRQKL